MYYVYILFLATLCTMRLCLQVLDAAGPDSLVLLDEVRFG